MVFPLPHMLSACLLTVEKTLTKKINFNQSEKMKKQRKTVKENPIIA